METNVYIEAAILACVSGALILVIKMMGNYEKVEQFLYENDRSKYYIMKACYLILIICLTVNIRYGVSQFLSDLAK